MRIQAKRLHWVLALCLAVCAQHAVAQTDIAGTWVRRGGEDARWLGGEGAHIGDYTGMPYNAAGRLRAETWDATVLSARERQAQPHNMQYYVLFGRIDRVVDPLSKQLIAYKSCCLFGGAARTIWLDGRPHPPAYAERTWQGFSTGKWVGNILTVTTTHLRTGALNRNGSPASLKSTVTEHYIRHGDQLTVMQIVEDPAYLEQPMPRTIDFVLNPLAGNDPNPERFEIIDEIPDWQPGYVPSYPPGAKHADWAAYVGLPFELTHGGWNTLLPEYVPVARKLLSDYQKTNGASGTTSQVGER